MKKSKEKQKVTKQQEKINRQQQMKIENEARNQQINEVSSREVSDVNIDVFLMISLCGNMTNEVQNSITSPETFAKDLKMYFFTRSYS